MIPQLQPAQQFQQFQPSQFPVSGPLNQMAAFNNNSYKNYTTLYIGDLEDSITEEILYKFFNRFGSIFSIKVMRDSNKKVSRGFAYVSFYQQKDAENARLNANHQKIFNNPMRVTLKKNLQKEVTQEANVFVQNLDEKVEITDLESAFSQFGPIFSSKIMVDESGKSRGYGYVQFEQKEGAEKCIQDSKNGLFLQNKQVKVTPFTQRKDRPEPKKTNLYIKNFPSHLTEVSQLETELLQVSKQFGTVTSYFFKKDPNFQQFYAFVTFEKEDQAQKAYEELQKDTYFNGQLFVNWAQSKKQRKQLLEQSYSSSVNLTNFFTKNLKDTVTKEQLKKVLSQYGEIDNHAVLKPTEQKKAQYSGQKQTLSTLFGFFNFKNKSDAEKFMSLLQKRLLPQEIKDLYEGASYIALHQKKSQFQNIQQSKNRAKAFQAPKMDPFLMQYMMLQMQQQIQMMYGQQFFGNPMGQKPGFPFNPFNAMPNQQNPFAQPMMRANNGFPANNFNPKFSNVRPMGPVQSAYPYPQQQRKPYVKSQNQFGAKVGQNVNPNYNKNNIRAQQNQDQKQISAQKQFEYNDQNLKTNLESFLKLEKEKQRTILGEILFPKVLKFSNQTDLAPKITGMLIDFEVFEVQEILEFLESDDNLKERVVEAEELIRTSSQ